MAVGPGRKRFTVSLLENSCKPLIRAASLELWSPMHKPVTVVQNTENLPDRPPPYPAEPGWRWEWAPAKPARWRARRERIRKYPKSLIPRRQNYNSENSVFSQGIALALPWPRAYDYPGRGILYRELFPEVTRDTITNWRRGGSMPDWAVERLASWLQARAEAMLMGASRLREEAPRDRRKGNGGRVPHRLRAERLAREAKERNRALNEPIAASNEPVRKVEDCRSFVERMLGRELE
jgi:hypothetical protein